MMNEKIQKESLLKKQLLQEIKNKELEAIKKVKDELKKEKAKVRNQFKIKLQKIKTEVLPVDKKTAVQNLLVEDITKAYNFIIKNLSYNGKAKESLIKINKMERTEALDFLYVNFRLKDKVARNVWKLSKVDVIEKYHHTCSGSASSDKSRKIFYSKKRNIIIPSKSLQGPIAMSASLNELKKWSSEKEFTNP